MSSKLRGAVSRLVREIEDGMLVELSSKFECDLAKTLLADIKTALCEKSSQVGNGAKMREALEWIQDRLVAATHDGGMDTYEALRIVEAALAEPPRNCDIGTADEQYNRHCKWCKKMRDYSCAQSMCRECYAKWAQMPYEEGETDADE